MRHGYARGHQAVIYVGNIRSYYDMLVWITRDKNAEPKTELEAAEEKKKQTDPDDAKEDDTTPLNIDSPVLRSEEHTSELQSLMRISYAVFCLKKQNKTNNTDTDHTQT